MATTESIEKELASIAGRREVRKPSTDLSVDGFAPTAVVRPAGYDRAASVLAWANERGLAVIPLGGRGHVGRGNLPARYDIALDMTALDKVVEFEPGDLTITVQAGMTVAGLRKTTAASGLLSPFDPWAPDGATVGGMIAAGVAGPARISLGTPRDFTIGLRVATADGRISRAGGKVVKNVSGYDLCKLYSRSMGTLGVILEASIKLQPLPRSQETVILDFDSPKDACVLANRAYTAGLNLHAVVLSRSEASWQLALHLAGSKAGVERSRQEILRQVMAVEGDANARDIAGSTDVALSLSTLPSRLPSLLGEMSEAFPAAQIAAYPTVAICNLSGEAAAIDISLVQGVAAAHRASCVVERCPPDTKAHLDVFGDAIPGLDLMRRIKQTWDPNGTLSPGRGPGRL